jgi:hypothetical protein
MLKCRSWVWYRSVRSYPLDGDVCPSYGCHDQRSAQKISTSFPCSFHVALPQITLCGRPSAGSRKGLGTHRAGASRAIPPWANRKDVEYQVDYAVKEVRARIRFVFVRTMREVLDAAFGPGLLPWRAPDAHTTSLRKIHLLL